MSEEQSTTLPFYVENIEDVPNEVRAFYTQDEQGSYNLNVDGVVSKRKLDEFRDNNRKLSSQLQDIESKYRHVDLEEYKNLKEKIETETTKGFVPETDIDKQVSSRVKKMQEDFEATESTYKTTIQNQQKRLSELLINNEVSRSATEANALPSALDDILNRVSAKFSVNDEGNVVATDGNGEVEYNKKGDPLSIADFIKGLKENAPHLFQTSAGAGTRGNVSNIVPQTKKQMTAREMIVSGLGKR